MSIPINMFYKLTGWATVEVYTENQMAEALGISVKQLCKELQAGYGLCYHAHPAATNNGYLFTESAYQANLSVFACKQSGGHDYQAEFYYDYLPNGALKCAKCKHIKFL